MTTPAPTDSTAYYLGIEGEQAGPFSEKEMIQKLKEGSVPPDSLIWWDGLPEWRPIGEIPLFKGYFTSEATQVGAPLEASNSPQAPSLNPSHLAEVLESPVPEESGVPATFSSSGRGVAPVFSLEDSIFRGPSFLHSRILIIVVGFLGLALLAGGIFFFFASQSVPLLSKVRGDSKEQRLAARQILKAKAVSELYLSPDKSIEALKGLVKENPQDVVGKEAIQALLDYFRLNQRYKDAGNFLMQLKKPSEAAKIFAQDPKAALELEGALFAAFEEAAGSEKPDLLLQDIRVLLNPLGETNKALERIRIFEKAFPGATHPYGYYLLPVDQRIQNIFNRLAFFFVQGLMTHIGNEFPQVALVGRPLIEVKRNARGDYRIVARYQGEVLLNKERLPKTYFIFWLVGDQWILVDTNLTKERQRYAASAREKYESSVMNPLKTLQFLETQFKTQYPKVPLHEAAPTDTKTSNTRQE